MSNVGFMVHFVCCFMCGTLLFSLSPLSLLSNALINGCQLFVCSYTQVRRVTEEHVQLLLESFKADDPGSLPMVVYPDRGVLQFIMSDQHFVLI